MKRGRLIVLLGVTAHVLALTSPPAQPCTRVVWATSLDKVFVGRTHDWTEAVGNRFRSFPRGQAREGLVGAGSLEWKSRFGSLVLVGYNLGTHEGMNEKGLAARVHSLQGTDYGKRDPKRPGLAIALWAQYFLDNFATVKECVEFLSKNDVQIVPVIFPNGVASTLHLSLEDRTGDSVVIQYVKGRAKIHSTREYGVVTNEPLYEEQIANLKLYKPFGGERALPGEGDPKSRFVRAAYYASRLPKPKSEREAVALLLGVLRNASAPFETADKAGPDYSPTQWRSVMNLTDGVYYFESATRLNLLWVRLTGVKLAESDGEREFDPEAGPDVNGDVTQLLKPAKAFEFKAR